MQKSAVTTTRCQLIAAAAAVCLVASPSGAAAASVAPTATGPVFVVSDIQRALGTRPALGVPVTNRLTLHPDVARRDPARDAIARMEAAGDRIAKRPYVYGGGHGSFDSAGYDCSGSLSYVLHAAGLLDAPLASGGLMSYGRPGEGKHVTIYANAGHAFMTIDGRRFDTIAFKATGTRWASDLGSTEGYVVRHPAGM